jgi:hypothetical protein
VTVIGEEGAVASRDPSVTPRQGDPGDPATWIRPVVCDGHDRHSLTPPWQHAVGAGAAGAILIAVDLHWHVYGRSLGAGIGLLLLPVFTVLFARWVDGPILCYRTWGWPRRLDLNTVTAVGVGKQAAGTRSVRLSAPGLRKPLRVGLRDRRYVMPPATREHLRRWLSSPRVHWDPEAVALFDGGAAPRTSRRSRLVVALVIVGSLCVVATALWLAPQRRPHHPIIAGAPGYHLYGGPHGRLLAVGRPWGTACQPVRFTVEAHVPDWIYQQATAVVSEARQDGINVTIETRSFMWTPGSLYYAPGQTPDTTVRVPIFIHDGTPPRRRDGKPQRISLEWDARLVDGGRHEAVTGMQGILYPQSIGHDPRAARWSVRQLIAMTQGIIDADRSDSAIALDSTSDRFSAADVAAMNLMSGCGNAVGPPLT